MRARHFLTGFLFLAFLGTQVASAQFAGIQPPINRPLFSNETSKTLDGYVYADENYSQIYYLYVYNRYSYEDNSFEGTDIYVQETLLTNGWEYRTLACTIGDARALQIKPGSATLSPVALDMSSPNCSTGGEHKVCHYEDPENPWCTSEPWGFEGVVMVGATLDDVESTDQGISESHGVRYGVAHTNVRCQTLNGWAPRKGSFSFNGMVMPWYALGNAEYSARDCVTQMTGNK
jgi:hypothetical protein